MAVECLAKIRLHLGTELQAEHLTQLANKLRVQGSPWTALDPPLGPVFQMTYCAQDTPQHIWTVAQVCAALEARLRRFESFALGPYVLRKYAPTVPLDESTPAPESRPVLGDHLIHVTNWDMRYRSSDHETWLALSRATRGGPVEMDTRVTAVYAAVLQLFTAPYGRCTAHVVGRGHVTGRDSFDLYVRLQIHGDPLYDADAGYAAFVAEQLTPPRRPWWRRVIAYFCR